MATQSALVPVEFHGATLSASIIDGAPCVAIRPIVEALGLDWASQFTRIKRHPVLSATVVVTTTAMNSHCKGVALRYPLQTAGGLQDVRVLSEPDVLRLIVRSTLPEAERFEKWLFEEVLPAIRKTGSYTAPGAAQSTPATERATIAMMVAESAARILRIEGVPLLGYITDVAEQFSPEAARALPSYGANRPAGSAASANSELTRSLTDLLKIHGIDSSARKINPLLIAAGILEQKTRPSSKGGIKEFLSVTARGLQYGINQTAKQNQLETSPRFFESRFTAMMDEIGQAI